MLNLVGMMVMGFGIFVGLISNLVNGFSEMVKVFGFGLLLLFVLIMMFVGGLFDMVVGGLKLGGIMFGLVLLLGLV